MGEITARIGCHELATCVSRRLVPAESGPERSPISVIAGGGIKMLEAEGLRELEGATG